MRTNDSDDDVVAVRSEFARERPSDSTDNTGAVGISSSLSRSKVAAPVSNCHAKTQANFFNAHSIFLLIINRSLGIN